MFAGTAADIARAMRENSFDRDECYRVRDLTLIKEDMRDLLYRRLPDLQQAGGRPADGGGFLRRRGRRRRRGDPAAARSRASAARSPPLSARRTSTSTSRAALLLFTGDEYEQLIAQMANNPANRKAPEMAPVLDEQWAPVLRNLGRATRCRLTLDLMGGPARRRRLFAAMFSSTKLGNFDLVYDPDNIEQILAGQLATRQDRLYFDTWTSFPSRSSRKNPTPKVARSASRRLPHRCHGGTRTSR